MKTIIEMAREAGLIVDANQSGFDSVEAFAALVRAEAQAEERERLLAGVEMPVMPRAFICTKCGSLECQGDIKERHPQCANCGYLGFANDTGYTPDQLCEFAAAAVAHKREKLLDIVYGYANHLRNDEAFQAAIKLR